MPTRLAFLACVALIVSGCSTYLPPGPKADLAHFAPSAIQEGFDRRPSSPFPASIVGVRLQGPGYTNHNLRQNGSSGTTGTGAYSVVLTREIEDGADLAQIGRLPRITGLGALNRMLLPAQINGDAEIRAAVARIQGDLAFLYTFDTAFFDTDASRPLSVITLGLSPTRKIRATTTASALLMDTRTGFIHAVYEVTEQKSTLATSWGTRDTADEARRDTERAAFRKLVAEFVEKWPQVLAKYDTKAVAGSP